MDKIILNKTKPPTTKASVSLCPAGFLTEPKASNPRLQQGYFFVRTQ